MTQIIGKKLATAMAIAAAVTVTACSDSGSSRRMPVEPPVLEPTPEPVATRQFEISLSNLTVGQPLSPHRSIHPR